MQKRANQLSQKYLLGIIVFVLVLAAIAISIGFLIKPQADSVSTNEKPVTAQELISSPNDYKNSSITFVGKVFSADHEGYVLQVYSDVENLDDNIIVYSTTPFKENDYVMVNGTVIDPVDGENAFGASLTIPAVEADSVKKISADEALAPTQSVKKFNEVRRVGNLTISLQKVEYAEKESRIYLNFNNMSSGSFTFYSFDAKLVQSGKRIKSVSDYGRDDTFSPEDGEILAKTSQPIKLYFEPLVRKKTATLSFEVMDQDYNSTNISFSFSE